MTERKVLNKYYPPDYDPRLLPKMTKAERANVKWVQRVMVPFNCRCNTCGEYIYKGKKFNMRREKVSDEVYLGIPIWRFYFRCPRCLADITFKTDLRNCDYAEEHGAKRLFEAENLLKAQIAADVAKEADEKTDPMKMLEKRTKMSRREMDALGQLEELRELQARQSNIDQNAIVSEIQEEKFVDLRKQEELDEQFVQSIFGKKEDGPQRVMKRLKEESDDEESDDEKLPPVSVPDFKTKSTEILAGPSSSRVQEKLFSQRKLIAGMVKPKAKQPKLELEGTVPTTPSSSNSNQITKPAATGAGLSLLCGYGGSDESGEESSKSDN